MYILKCLSAHHPSLFSCSLITSRQGEAGLKNVDIKVEVSERKGRGGAGMHQDYYRGKVSGGRDG